MKASVLSRKVYCLDPVEDDIRYLEDALAQAENPHTAVFYKSEDSGNGGLDLLEKILAAAKLKASDYILLDHSLHRTVKVRHLRQSAPDIKNLLVFELPMAEIGLSIQLSKYEIHTIAPYRMLVSDPLNALSEQEVLKRKLWNALKDYYAL